MNMLRALEQPKVLQALTGVKPTELATPIATFGQAWDAHQAPIQTPNPWFYTFAPASDPFQL